MKIRNLTYPALLLALGMILSFVESLLPGFAPIPGVKLGLGNLVTLYALLCLGARPAALLSLARICLSALLFGNPGSFLYSLAGACCSYAVMLLLHRCGRFSPIGISVGGAVAHNIGQLAVAALVMRTAGLGYYTPVLLLSGTLAGLGIGAAGAALVRYLPAKLQTK